MSSSILGSAFSREDVTVQSHYDRPNTITGGHKACQGCGEALAARCVIDAAYEAADGKIVLVNATGCLEVFSSVYPENSWNVPWIHSLFGNAPAVAAGIIAALEKQGQKNVRVIAQGGDGATADIGMGCLSGMFDRNDDVLYVCYDNQAYMNTGVQRSGATPPLARTATTLPNKIYLGNSEKTGKNVPQIAIAHGIPYVATASVGNIHDLEQKVVKAIRIRGAKYIHIHVPCPLGWGYPSAETIKIAKLAIQCGLFPLFEAENGQLIRSVPIDDQICVDDYLRIQKRFFHLYGKNVTTDIVRILQNIANENVEKYGLKRDVADE